MEKLAVMELLLSQDKPEDFDINRVIKEFAFQNLDEVEQNEKKDYILN